MEASSSSICSSSESFCESCSASRARDSIGIFVAIASTSSTPSRPWPARRPAKVPVSILDITPSASSKHLNQGYLTSELLIVSCLCHDDRDMQCPAWRIKIIVLNKFEHLAFLHSFPSGHTCTQCSIVFTLIYIFPKFKYAGILSLAIILPANSLSLMHYPSDILFSIIFAYSIYFLLKLKFKLV